MLPDLLRRAKRAFRARRALSEIAARAITRRPHGLDQPLVVSVTSYPPRFGVLAQTLRGLLRQTVQPDHTILWVAPDDYALVPADVLALQAQGLTIATDPAWRSYRKIVPALRAYPGHAIVTADDDVYYWPSWLEELVEAHSRTQAQVICHRADRMVLGADGGPVAYDDWERPMRMAGQSPLVLATGVLGVLYGPDAFYPDVTDETLYRSLAPSSDDLWLYWMYRMQGHAAMRIGGRRRILEWPGSQKISLRSENMLGATGNDRAVQALRAHYGMPPLG